MVANLAQEAIGADDNEVMLFDDAGTHTLPRAPKEAGARGNCRAISQGCYGARQKKCVQAQSTPGLQAVSPTNAADPACAHVSFTDSVESA